MIAAMRGAVFEALRREEEMVNMYVRLSKEATDQTLKDFLLNLADDVKNDMETMKHLNLHSIIKFGLAIRFEMPEFGIDEKTAETIKDKQGAKDILKLCVDEISSDIEYYEHISNHALFPEVQRLYRIIADKELVHKAKIKALFDLL